MDKSQWLEENGFDNDENTYCIIGNTFNNKEYFKHWYCFGRNEGRKCIYKYF